mgnify:CR=1 FL=1
MGSNGASGGGGGNTGREKGAAKNRSQKTTSSKSTNTNTGNKRKDARSRSQVNTGMSRSSASTGTSNVGGVPNSSGGPNGGNQVVQAPKVTSPTTAEVSQAAPEVTSEEARASANELIRKRRRGRGRSLSMLQTSSQGLDNKGLTLGKPTLLG